MLAWSFELKTSFLKPFFIYCVHLMKTLWGHTSMTFTKMGNFVSLCPLHAQKWAIDIFLKNNRIRKYAINFRALKVRHQCSSDLNCSTPFYYFSKTQLTVDENKDWMVSCNRFSNLLLKLGFPHFLNCQCYPRGQKMTSPKNQPFLTHPPLSLFVTNISKPLLPPVNTDQTTFSEDPSSKMYSWFVIVNVYLIHHTWYRVSLRNT